MFVEDLAPYFVDFAVAGTLAGQPVRVIFDEPTDLTLDQRLRRPQAQIASASVPAAWRDAALVIPQGSFTVRDVEADGSGLSLLMLTRVS